MQNNIRSMLESHFGKGDLSRDKINLAIQCPSCGENRPDKKKLIVRLDNGMFHCWVCGLKGKNLSFLFRKFRGKNVSFDGLKTFSGDEKKVVKIPDGFHLLSRHSRDPDVMAVKKYLARRGVGQSDIARWRMLAYKSGSLRRRVVIPSFDIEGRINYYVARTIDDIKMRYKNPPVKKNEIIFNECDIDWQKTVVLVEGVFDAIKVGNNVIPILGSSVSKSSLLYKQLVNNQSNIIVALDSDCISKAYEICETFTSGGCEVRVCFPSAGRDLGDMESADVKKLLYSAKPYSKMMKITHKIHGIKSGSII